MAGRYCLDSSSIIAAWDERYPPEIFPPFWELLDAAISAGRVFVPEAVIDELEKKSKAAAKWFKDRDACIIPYEAEIQLQAKAILSAFPKLIMEQKYAFAADPFVIGTAIVHGLVVVTEEGMGNPNKPKIPMVCAANTIDCLKLLEFIRAEAWVVGKA